MSTTEFMLGSWQTVREDYFHAKARWRQGAPGGFLFRNTEFCDRDAPQLRNGSRALPATENERQGRSLIHICELAVDHVRQVQVGKALGHGRDTEASSESANTARVARSPR